MDNPLESIRGWLRSLGQEPKIKINDAQRELMAQQLAPKNPTYGTQIPALETRLDQFAPLFSQALQDQNDQGLKDAIVIKKMEGTAGSPMPQGFLERLKIQQGQEAQAQRLQDLFKGNSI